MPSYSTEQIRNIALVGHGGAGKTTLVEAIFHRAGLIPAMGSVDRGTTICDYDPREKTHKHSLTSAVVHLDYSGAHFNIIDTPGYPDFIGRALAVLPAVETVAVVINAGSGVEMVSQRMMDAAKELGLDRLIIVNRIDAENLDLEKRLKEIQTAFGPECLPLNLPAGGGRRVIDCFFNTEEVATDFSTVQEAHTKIIDQVVEIDEKLMDLYLEQGEELSPEQLHAPFEQALREGHLVPVCFVSAHTGAGIAELLQVMAKLMPNPVEGNPPVFFKGPGTAATMHFEPDPKKHVLAHTFKVSIDPFAGRLGVFRIHQGTVSKDSQLYVGDARKPFKVGHLLKLQGKDTREIDAGVPGDLCAVAKVDDVHFGAVLHDSHDEDNIRLRPVNLPEPMYGLAIRAKSRGDEQKISDALHKIGAEDPSIRVEHNASTNETVIRGMGDLHLRIVLEDLKERFHVEVETRPPRIAYRETITSGAEGHYRHKKQTGGAGQFGEVYLRVEALPRGSGFEFVDEVVGGVIPRQFIPAVEKGIRQALANGVIAGYELQDVRVRVYDGKHHAVDSKEVAFVTAGKRAFMDAVKKAKPVVLEPIVNLRVVLPSASMGDITGDLSGRRGKISDTEVLPNGMIVINGQAPLSELEGYQSQLKSITGGAGSYTIELSHYDPVPAKTQQELMAAYKPVDVED
jgi:elongation factor G